MGWLGTYLELPQLLVIYLTATLFYGGNSNLEANILTIFVQFLILKLNELVFDLIVLFADQHLRNALFKLLGMRHVLNFFTDYGKMFRETLKRIKTVLKYGFNEVADELKLFSEVSHIYLNYHP